MEPLPPLRTLTSSISASQSSPVIDIELLAMAPMRPAMKVPWLVSTELVGPKPHPGTRRTLPARSGCWSWIPVSTIAIVTSFVPVVISHAAVAPIASKYHGGAYGAHPAKQGSLGFETITTSLVFGIAGSSADKVRGDDQTEIMTTSTINALLSRTK